MCKMKDLEQQLKNLIITNVPQSVDLMLPINENAELKTILLQIYTMVKETNEKSKATNTIISKLLHETEQSRIENWYRGKF